jgi:hypothetical protein
MNTAWRRNQLLIVLSVAFAAQYSCARHALGEVHVDDGRALSAGIRKLESQHLVLYTDLPASAGVDALPQVFDQAVPLWAEYFGVSKKQTADWRVQAFLVGDRERFAALELLPPNVDLLHGYSIGSDLWVSEQGNDYYRRHLLLHEGTHAFMNQYLGACGPGWYMEGVAELLGTHRVGAGTRERGAGRNSEKDPDTVLEIGIMPRSRDEVPMLGRIKLVQGALATDGALTLPAVMQIDNRKQLGNDAYAWCWAAAKFLDAHPRYRGRFRKLQRQVRSDEFNEIARREFGRDWEELKAEWLAFVTTLEHGYDFEQMAIDFRTGTPLRAQPRTATIAADRGWQSSGVLLEAGKTYRVSASGRFQIAVEDVNGVETRWPCEAGGVTIEYHAGHPLGMLLGAVVEGGSGKWEGGRQESANGGFARPFEIGLGTTISPKRSGTLYLRVNDSAARLGDNRGALTIRVMDR